MDFTNFLETMQEFLVPTILVTSFILGQILKQIKNLNQDYLPLILGAFGIFIATWSEGFSFDPQILLQGLASGWAASGAWEAYKNTIRDPQKTKKEEQKKKEIKE